jgi:uncharacterized protein involved in type VI secretion and phage assembly
MSENKHLAPARIIYIDGNRLAPAYEGALRSVRVTDQLNRVSQCTVSFNHGEVTLKNDTSMGFESRIAIYLGYKDDVTEVFSGEITEKSEFFPENGPDRFEIVGSNCLWRLEHGVHRRSFENKTASQAISDLLARYDLKGEVDTFGAERPDWEGGERTDLDLLFDLWPGRTAGCLRLW